MILSANSALSAVKKLLAPQLFQILPHNIPPRDQHRDDDDFPEELKEQHERADDAEANGDAVDELRELPPETGLDEGHERDQPDQPEDQVMPREEDDEHEANEH